MAPIGGNRYKHNFSIDYSESKQDVPNLLTDGLASCSLEEVSLGEGYTPRHNLQKARFRNVGFGIVRFKSLEIVSPFRVLGSSREPSIAMAKIHSPR